MLLNKRHEETKTKIDCDTISGVDLFGWNKYSYHVVYAYSIASSDLSIIINSWCLKHCYVEHWVA